MRTLELLAPARNASIGIAAIDCGADAVYIGGPDFGARKDAGNPMEEIAQLCSYAHRFGVRVYMTVNVILCDEELPKVHSQMLLAQDAGVDAFIIRDLRICGWRDITVPLHASTQCAIRDLDAARGCEAAGCSRIVLERELSLNQIREIASGVDCETECFVHGALCVCYSGECRLSEYLDGRSADRGACIQACRSLYDLVDADGRTLVRNKALLSLRDLDLHSRLYDLAAAGVESFKIEGRLKNASYVRNITRFYSEALDALVEAHPGEYRRASFGRLAPGFTPDPAKTFNRGYTSLFLDGSRSKWACIDAPKSMGERIGTVSGVRPCQGGISVKVSFEKKGTELRNGDGFAFVRGSSIVGFRADRCEGSGIFCKDVPGLRMGTVLYRNVSAAFEKELESRPGVREIPVALDVRISGKWSISITARTADGRVFENRYNADVDTAENRERAEAMIRGQLGKKSLHYAFSVETLEDGGSLPLLSSSTLNEMRRLLARDLDTLPCGRIPLANRRLTAQGPQTADEIPQISPVSNCVAASPSGSSVSSSADGSSGSSCADGIGRVGASSVVGPAGSSGSVVLADSDGRLPAHASAVVAPAGDSGAVVFAGSDGRLPAHAAAVVAPAGDSGAAAPGLANPSEAPLISGLPVPASRAVPKGQLMRSKYCIKFELGMCPVHQGAAPTGPLFLVNNGRTLALGFDCRSCEMTVSVPPSGN